MEYRLDDAGIVVTHWSILMGVGSQPGVSDGSEGGMPRRLA